MIQEKIDALLERALRQHQPGSRISVQEVGRLFARLCMACDPAEGGFSEPAMMAFADIAFRAAIAASAGSGALAMPTSLSFNFLRKPSTDALVAECRLVKLGKRLSVGEAALRHDGETELVCHVTGTYALAKE